MIPATITANSVNLFLDGRMRTIGSSHINYHPVLALLRCTRDAADEDMQRILSELRELVDIPAYVARLTEGRVTIFDNAVRFNDKPVAGVIAERLISLLHDGQNIKPLARFLDRLMDNPLESARDELYLWLETSHLPITEDGCFLAFKKVDENYRSYHAHPDGTHEPHNIGDRPTMPREQVDPDRENVCSRGYHFCSYDYLTFYEGRAGHVMVVKVAPEDVVAIPSDYRNQKGRTFRYEVVDEVAADEAQKFFAGTPVTDDYDHNIDIAFEDDDADDDADDYADDAADTSAPPVAEAPEAPEEKRASKVRKLLKKVGKALQKVGKIMDRNGKGHSPGKIAAAVAKHGQRATAEKYDIPRATLQRALKHRDW